MILPNIASIGQRDKRWKDKKLGTSSITIGDAGCVLCCSTIVCRFYGKDIWPDWLNEQMIKVGGYYDQNLWMWDKLTAIFPDIKVHELIDCYAVPAPLDKIDKRLEEGHPVIVCVDFDPKPGVQTHYVVIFGKDELGYYIADPWYDDVAILNERYGDPAKAIYAIRMYDGPLTPPVNQDVEELKGKVEELTKKVGELEGRIVELNRLLEEEKRKNNENQEQLKNLQNLLKISQETAEALHTENTEKTALLEKSQKELASANKKIEELLEENSNISKENTDYVRRYKNAREEIIELEKQIEELKKKTDIEELNVWEIVRLTIKKILKSLIKENSVGEDDSKKK